MDLRKLQRVIVDALEDVKAQAIEVFNTTGQTGLFDRVIVATGTSNRQTRALASHVRDKIKAAGGHVISVEGEDTGEWVLVDAGDAVVHIMQPAIRAYYKLEEIWGSKPVRMKSAAPRAGSHGNGELLRWTPAEAGEQGDDDAAAPKAGTRKSGAKASAAVKSAARKPATGKPAAAKASTAHKPASGKPAAKRSAAASGAGAGRKTGTASKAGPARKPASARKSPTAGKRPTTRKASAG